MKNILYYNTTFDAELSGKVSDRVRRIAAEMSVYALLAAREDDLVSLDAIPEEQFFLYLKQNGFPVRVADSVPPGLYGEPWGWSSSALARFDSLSCLSDHPPLEAVKKVNSRKFGIDVAKRLGGIPSGEIADNRNEAISVIKRSAFPLLVKPIHGNSGVGHFIVEHDEIPMKKIDRIFSESSSGISIEPLLDRIDDYAANFFLEKDSTVTGLTYHQCIIDKRGLFRGIRLSEELIDSHVIGKLSESVRVVSAALHEEGYFGHVGIDTFTYLRDGHIEIQPLCEINARRTMGEVARGCKQTLGGTYGILRQFSRLNLPDTYRSVQDLLSPFEYDSRQKKGIFIASPLSLTYENHIIRPAVTLVYIAAHSAVECTEMEDHIARVFLRKESH
ncbi:MAG TPA: hypothetical protein VF857_02740 [Spirochaetota bacterium]